MPDQIDNMADATPCLIREDCLWHVRIGDDGEVVLWDSAGVLRYHGQGLTSVAYHLVMSMADCDRLRCSKKWIVSADEEETSCETSATDGG